MRILAVAAIVLTAMLVAVLIWPAGQRRAERPAAPTREETVLPTTVVPTIEGTVVRGGPIADAEVTLWRVEPAPSEIGQWQRPDPLDALRPPQSAAALASTRADAEGRFRFDAPPGDYLVIARSPDGARGSRPLRLYSTADVGVVVAARAHTLKGLVRHADGRAARGFVRAHLVDGPLPFVATDAAGVFTLEGLPAGVCSLEALVPGEFRITESGVPVPYDGSIVLSVGRTFPTTLRGRVVAFADDRPIAGARVLLKRAPDLVATRTGDDGRFALPGTTRWADLWIVADDYAHHYAWGKPGLDSVYRLLRPATVRGVVVAGTRPLARARVEVRDMAGMKTTTTAADGRFVVHGVAPGEIFFFARADGWLPEGASRHTTWHWSRNNPFSLSLGAGADTHVEIRMEPVVHLEGVVLAPDGTPVRGARVVTGGEATPASATTDEEGRFRIETARRSRYAVRASAPGLGDSTAVGPGPFEIRLAPGRQRRVVVESDGPVEGARIESINVTVQGVWWTGADGTAEISPPQGAWNLRVAAEGFVPVRGKVGDPSEIHFTLKKARSVRVHVRFPDGRPAPGIALGAGYATAMTGPDGWSLLGPVPEGSARVHASAEGWRASGPLDDEETVLVLEEQETGREKDAPAFRLRIVDESGHSVPSGRVRIDMEIKTARSIPHYRSGREPKTRMFRDGLFELVQSEWFPNVSAENSITIEVLAAQTRDVSTGFGAAEGTPLPLGPKTIGPLPLIGEHEVILPAERRLQGRVVDDAGKPVASALVWAWPVDGAPGQRPISIGDDAQYDRTRTQQDGTFVLGRLGDGRVAVVVEPPRGFLPAGAVEAKPGDELTIRLGHGAQPLVTVTDTAGKPMAGAYVRVRFKSWNEPFREKRPGFWADDDDWGWRTNERGEVRIGGFEADRTYRLRVSPPPGRNDVAAEEVQGWKPRDTAVSLGRATTISGVVRDSRGRPRSRAYVYARFENGDGRIVHPDKKGLFEIKRVPEGKVRFTARIDGRDTGIDSKAEPVEVTAGARDVVVLIDLPPSVLLRIEGWDSRASNEATLHAEGGGSVSGWIQKDGRLDVVGVDPQKTWTTMIGPTPDGRYALLKGIVPSQEVRRVRLERGGEIRGRLNLPEKSTRVYLRVAHPIVSAYTEVADDGSFVMRGLPPGRWKIAVSAVTPRGTIEAEVEASPGDTVDLNPR